MSIRIEETEPLEEDIKFFEPRDIQLKSKQWVVDEYDIMDFLGSGKFGEVKRCREKATERLLAAKFISVCNKDEKQNVINEIEIMKKLQHPRLLQLYDAFDASSSKLREMCLVLEIIEGGELFERVVDDDFILTEKACACFCKQIVEGVGYMHSKLILHLDMKPENILCLTRTGNRVKIIDFGLAKEYNPKKKLMVLAGTPEFVAPEIVNYEGVSYSTDMWSIGVIVYVLLSGLSPFVGDHDMDTLQNVTSCQWNFDYPEFDNISNEAKDFISKLLIKDHRKRLKSEQCMSHPWLQNNVRKPETSLSKTRLKRFVIRRKWQKAVNTILALTRMGIQLVDI
ncbi:myosin light chain kinase, smooth muscle-like [Tubulanus polymorphus]|uniref:myosin light chain kinase, smooth muscle-like n=1 Tax=Tubulanus polymorphus TaxID=672921 RepID=UPI003DA2C368